MRRCASGSPEHFADHTFHFSEAQARALFDGWDVVHTQVERHPRKRLLFKNARFELIAKR